MNCHHVREDTYPLLEVVNLIVRDCVSLGNNGDQIDLGVQLLHDLNIEGLERVAGRLDEVDNGMNAVVDNVHAVDLVLSVQVGIEPLLNVLDNWIPRLIVVYEVAKARCVNDC